MQPYHLTPLPVDEHANSPTQSQKRLTLRDASVIYGFSENRSAIFNYCFAVCVCVCVIVLTLRCSYMLNLEDNQ